MYEYKFQSRKSSLIHLEQILKNPILNENLLIEFCAKSTKISRIHQIYIHIVHLRVNPFNQRHGECVGRESSYSTKRTCQLKRRARNDRSKWIPDLAISFDDLAFPRRQFVGALIRSRGLDSREQFCITFPSLRFRFDKSKAETIISVISSASIGPERLKREREVTIPMRCGLALSLSRTRDILAPRRRRYRCYRDTSTPIYILLRINILRVCRELDSFIEISHLRYIS